MRFSKLINTGKGGVSERQEKEKKEEAPLVHPPLSFASSSSSSTPPYIQLEIDNSLSHLLQSRQAAAEAAEKEETDVDRPSTADKRKSPLFLQKPFEINTNDSSSTVPVTFVKLETKTGFKQSAVPLTSREWWRGIIGAPLSSTLSSSSGVSSHTSTTINLPKVSAVSGIKDNDSIDLEEENSSSSSSSSSSASAFAGIAEGEAINKPKVFLRLSNFNQASSSSSSSSFSSSAMSESSSLDVQPFSVSGFSWSGQRNVKTMQAAEPIGGLPESVTDSRQASSSHHLNFSSVQRRYWGEPDILDSSSSFSSTSSSTVTSSTATDALFSLSAAPFRASEHIIDSAVEPLSTAAANSVLDDPLAHAQNLKWERRELAAKKVIEIATSSSSSSFSLYPRRQQSTISAASSSSVHTPIDIGSGSWTNRLILDPEDFLAKRVDANLNLGLLDHFPPPPPLLQNVQSNHHLITKHTIGGVTTIKALENAQTQAFFSFGSGTKQDIMNKVGSGVLGGTSFISSSSLSSSSSSSSSSSGKVGGGHSAISSSSSSSAAAGPALMSTSSSVPTSLSSFSETSLLLHARQAADPVHRRSDEWLYWRKGHPLPTDSQLERERWMRLYNPNVQCYLPILPLSSNGMIVGTTAASDYAHANAGNNASLKQPHSSSPSSSLSILPRVTPVKSLQLGGANSVSLLETSPTPFSASASSSSGTSSGGGGGGGGGGLALDDLLAATSSTGGGLKIAMTLRAVAPPQTSHIHLPHGAMVSSHTSATAGVGLLSSTSNAAAAGVLGAAAVSTTSLAHNDGSAVNMRLRPDLSLSSGDVILFEFHEQRPVFMLNAGMSSRIVTYYRARSDDEISEESMAEGLDEVGGSSSSKKQVSGTRRRAAGAPDIDIGTLEILRPKEPFPLLGSLEPGASITCLVNGLYRAPIFLQKTSSETTFLLIVKAEGTKGGSDGGGGASSSSSSSSSSSTTSNLLMKDQRVKDSLMTNQRPESSSTDITSSSSSSSSSSLLPHSLSVGYLREIRRVYVVGQLQPRVEVFPPMYRGPRGALIFDKELTDCLRSYASFRLLTLIAEKDRRFTIQAKKDGKLPQSSGVTSLHVGVISAREAYRDFDFSPQDVSEEDYIRLVSGVAVYDETAHVLTAKGSLARTASERPQDLAQEFGLTPLLMSVFESMRAGLSLLQASGLRHLRVEEGPLGDAVKSLQVLYDRMVMNLKRSTASAVAATTGAISSTHKATSIGGGGGSRLQDSTRMIISSSSSSSSSELWEHDGGFRRLKRTLEIAQAIVYALALTPWTTTRNFRAFSSSSGHGSDLSALALQDPNGVGDPSGSGEFFSFVPESASRSLSVKPKLVSGSGSGGGGGGGGFGGGFGSGVGGGFGGGGPLDPNSGAPTDLAGKIIREGTDRDLRALTQVTMAQMLMDYGVPVQRIRALSRWERVALIRDIQNAELVSAQKEGAGGGGGGGGAGGDDASSGGGLLFTGDSKMSSRERKRIKEEQVREIFRRQVLALTQDDDAITSPRLIVDDDGHGGSDGMVVGGVKAAMTTFDSSLVSSAMSVDDDDDDEEKGAEVAVKKEIEGVSGEGEERRKKGGLSVSGEVAAPVVPLDSEDDGDGGEEEEDNEDPALDGDTAFDQNLADELERAYGSTSKLDKRIGGGIARARAAAKRQAAEDDERAEFEGFRQSVREGTLFTAKGRSGASSSSSSSSSKNAQEEEEARYTPQERILRALLKRFPDIPVALLRPPHAPLSAAHPIAGLNVTREGARNPRPVSELKRPALDGDNYPVWTPPVVKSESTSTTGGSGNGGGDGGSSAWGARGKILRITRTVIDDKGTQRVYMTYTTNKYAIMQAWLKQKRNIDLGSIGPTKEILRDGRDADTSHSKNKSTLAGVLSSSSIAPAGGGGRGGNEEGPRSAMTGAQKPGYGLVSTGLYRLRTFTGIAGKRMAQADGERLLTHYLEMKKLGFIIQGGKSRVKHIYINGSPVPVCEKCSIWGHRGSTCPWAQDLVKKDKDGKVLSSSSSSATASDAAKSSSTAAAAASSSSSNASAAAAGGSGTTSELRVNAAKTKSDAEIAAHILQLQQTGLRAALAKVKARAAASGSAVAKSSSSNILRLKGSSLQGGPFGFSGHGSALARGRPKSSLGTTGGGGVSGGSSSFDPANQNVPLRHRSDVLREPLASREFATLLEEKAMNVLQNELFAPLWDFSDFLASSSTDANTTSAIKTNAVAAALNGDASCALDLRGLRLNIVHRRYPDWHSFSADLDRFMVSALTFFGDSSSAGRAAILFEKEVKDRLDTKKIRNAATLAVDEMMKDLLPLAAKVLLKSVGVSKVPPTPRSTTELLPTVISFVDPSHPLEIIQQQPTQHQEQQQDGQSTGLQPLPASVEDGVVADDSKGKIAETKPGEDEDEEEFVLFEG